MKIEYHSDYFNDPDARASFDRYAKEIFGLPVPVGSPDPMD